MVDEVGLGLPPGEAREELGVFVPERRDSIVDIRVGACVPGFLIDKGGLVITVFCEVYSVLNRAYVAKTEPYNQKYSIWRISILKPSDRLGMVVPEPPNPRARAPKKQRCRVPDLHQNGHVVNARSSDVQKKE